MNTGIIARTVALMLGWAGISGLASAQALGSTTEEEKGAAAYERVAEVEEVAEVRAADAEEAIAKMGAWLGTFDQIRASLERNDGFIRSDDELVLAFLFEPMEGESKLFQEYLKSVVVAMNTVPESFYEQLDGKVEALWTEIHRIAPRVSPIAGVEADGIVRSAIEKRVRLGAPRATVVRTVLSGDRWNIRMTDAGIPRSEYRRGHVMYRLPGQDLVICQQIVVERPYFGKATSADDHNVRLGYLRLQQNP